MKNDTTLLAFLGRHARRYWPGCVLAVMVALLWMRSSLVYAAPLHQTVPPPTPTQESAPVPTATPVPDENDDDDNDTPTPAPTWTPTTPAQPEPTQPQPTQPVQPEPAQVQPTPTAGALTGVVTVARLNVRQGPGTNFGVIGTVISGQTVTILSRSSASDWWRVCCASGTNQDGWVAAQYVQPNFDLGQADTLIPVDEALPEPPPEPTATPILAPEGVPTTTLTAVLELQLQQDPPYAWQGQTITLTYQIENRSEVAATGVEMRNELPAELTLVGVPTLAAGTLMTETTDIGRTVVVVRWPELQAGAAAAANVQVQVAEGMADGSVIDNLAAVVADDVQPVTAGISIGLPPVTLPDFQ